MINEHLSEQPSGTERPRVRRLIRGRSAASVVGLAAIALTAVVVGIGERGLLAGPLTRSGAAAASVSANMPVLELPSFADLVDRVKPAVVSVYVKSEDSSGTALFGAPGPQDNGNPSASPFEQFFRQFGQPELRAIPRIVQAQGSGFFISADGYILTNNHVVDHARSVQVKTVDGKSYSGKVVGIDPKTDLAVLKVSGSSNFPFVTFADTQPRVGDWVVAMGNPFGLGGTVTAGIVSASGRDIGAGPYSDYLQIDAPVNKGNSGGPSFNLQGQVVGINTAIYSPSGGSVGIAFDIPATTAKVVAQELEQKGIVIRGWIGVSVQAVTSDIAESLGLKDVKGALIDDVQDGGPAAKAGLKSGDVILSVDGVAINDSRDLARKIAAENPGKSVKLAMRRSGTGRTIDLTIASLPNEAVKQPAQANAREAKLGLLLAPARQVAGAGTDGVVVVDINPEGAAAEKGMQQGDVILSVGGKAVSTPEEVSRDLNEARQSGKHSVLLRLNTASGAHFVAVPTGSG